MVDLKYDHCSVWLLLVTFGCCYLVVGCYLEELRDLLEWFVDYLDCLKVTQLSLRLGVSISFVGLWLSDFHGWYPHYFC